MANGGRTLTTKVYFGLHARWLIGVWYRRVAVGFINGVPTIRRGNRRAWRPPGHRLPAVRLQRLFHPRPPGAIARRGQSQGPRNVEVLPPLGLDPGLTGRCGGVCQPGGPRTRDCAPGLHRHPVWPMARGVIRPRAKPRNRSRAGSQTEGCFERSGSRSWRKGPSLVKRPHPFRARLSSLDCFPERACTAQGMRPG